MHEPCRVGSPSSEARRSCRTEQVHGNIRAEALGRDDPGLMRGHPILDRQPITLPLETYGVL